MRIFNLQDLGAFGLAALGLEALSLAHLDAEFAIDRFSMLYRKQNSIEFHKNKIRVEKKIKLNKSYL
jgi:hypothetical protein